MRQFRLINGNGETFDLMREDAFFHAPGGLGFDREIESMMAGYEFVELRDDLAQKQITGEMVFLGYEQYKEFISFIGVKPLRLEYKPLNQWHRIRVKVQRIGKTEISRVGRLICAIDFLAFSTWYNVLNYETVPEEEPEYENLMVRGNAIHIVEDDDDSYTIGASTDADDVVKRFLSGDLATTENTVPVQLPGFTGDTYQLTAGNYFFKAIGKRQGVRSYFKVKPLVKTASGNPIQIQDAIEVAPNSLEVSVSPKQDGTPWIGSETDTDPYTFRAMPSIAAGANREYDKLIGASVVWNQVFDETKVSSSGSITVTVSNHKINVSGTTSGSFVNLLTNANVIPITPNHVYFCGGKATSKDFIYALFDSSWGGQGSYAGNTIFQASATATRCHPRLANMSAGETINEDITGYMLIDLTQMFGSTVANAMTVDLFRKYFPASYYAYDAGSIQSVSVSEKVTTGFNQWDEEWELGVFDTVTGAKSANSQRIRSKNLIPALPSTTYYAKKATLDLNIFFYDGNGNYLYYVSKTNDTFTTPSSCAFIAFYVGGGNITTYANDICINLSDPAKNGTYEAYAANSYALDDTELRGIFSIVDGQLVAAGDERFGDYITSKYGIIDLGTLSYTLDSVNNRFYTTGLAGTIRLSGWANGIVVGYTKGSTISDEKSFQVSASGYVYFRDTQYTTAAAFKTAMAGVFMVYEKETPLTVSNYGKELLSSLTWSSPAARTYKAALPGVVTTSSDRDDFLIDGYIARPSLSDNSAWINNGSLYVYESDAATLSDFEASLGSKSVIYPLAAAGNGPVYTNPQIIDPNGTESYTDAGVDAGTRDVAIPVGHSSNYALQVPIEGTDEIDTWIHGRNLWNGGDISGTQGVIVDTPFPAGTYTISAIPTSADTDASTCAVQFRYVGSTYSPILQFSRGTRNSKTVTLTKQANRITFYASDNNAHGAGDSFSFADIQIETGSVEHDYEPYTGSTTYTHTNASTIYGGSVDFVSGEETSEMVSGTVGDVSWTYHPTYHTFYGTLSGKANGVGNISSEAYFTDTTSTNWTTMQDGAIRGVGTSDTVFIKDTRYDNTTDFINDMGSMQIVYELATPTTASGTPDGVTLLKGENVISTDGDDIDLSYDAYPDSRLVLDVYGELAPDPDSAADTQIVSNFTVYDDQEVQFYMDQEDIPFDYSVEAFLAAGSYPANKVYGYPYPYSYSGSVNGEMDVFNGSTVAGYCRLTIQGPVEDPIWAVYQNGQLLQRGKITATIPEGHVLVVDSSPTELEISERTLDGELVANRYADSDFSTVRFITIPPGSSKVVVTQTGDEPITAYLEVDELEATV